MVGAPEPSEWLSRPAQVQLLGDRDVIALLKQAEREINRTLRRIDAASPSGIGEVVRREQLALVKRELRREQAALWQKLGDSVKARRLQAASRVIELGQELDEYLLRTVGGLVDGEALAEAIAQAERDAARAGLDRLMARVKGQSYVPLSDRVYNSSVSINSTLDRMVNSALAQGLSAREFAKVAAPYINPSTPGGIRYAAMRLSRTEINNAAHAMSINMFAEKPWVERVKWNLSGSHPKPDICNELASGGYKGRGEYEPADAPAKPHPHCFCFLTPVTPDDDEFLDNLLDGRYDDYLARYEHLQSP